jgi:hypothetical protein
MLSKKLLSVALLITSYGVSAETEFLTTYTDVETFVEAKTRLGKQDVLESDLIRTHYIVERDLDTKKVIIRPLEDQLAAYNNAL